MGEGRKREKEGARRNGGERGREGAAREGARGERRGEGGEPVGLWQRWGNGVRLERLSFLGATGAVRCVTRGGERSLG